MIRFLFDSETRIGCALAFVTNLILLINFCHAVVCGLGQIFGFYQLMWSFGCCAQEKFRALNENYINDPNDAKIRAEFYDAIQFHAEIKELNYFLLFNWNWKFQ